MTAPRGRLVRPPPAPAVRHERPGRLQKARQRLEKERATLARWMARLKRAFHAVEKAQRRLTRRGRAIAREEGYPPSPSPASRRLKDAHLGAARPASTSLTLNPKGAP